MEECWAVAGAVTSVLRLSGAGQNGAAPQHWNKDSWKMGKGRGNGKGGK